jgi:hypothetical protein
MGQDTLGDAVTGLRPCSQINGKHAQPRLLRSQPYLQLGKGEEAGRKKEISLKLRRARLETAAPAK